MDYKELIENLKNMLPEKILYSDLIGAEGAYAHSGPLVYEDPEPYFIEQAISAITELIAHVEDTENSEQKVENSRTVARGRWEPGNPICPICGESKFKELDADIWADWMPPYCPNCGADMREEKP